MRISKQGHQLDYLSFCFQHIIYKVVSYQKFFDYLYFLEHSFEYLSEVTLHSHSSQISSINLEFSFFAEYPPYSLYCFGFVDWSIDPKDYILIKIHFWNRQMSYCFGLQTLEQIPQMDIEQTLPPFNEDFVHWLESESLLGQIFTLELKRNRFFSSYDVTVGLLLL